MRREKPSQKSKKNKNIILSPKIRAQKYIENKNPKSHAFKDKSVFKKLIFIFLEGPLNILRRLTIPASDGESWNKIYAVAMPVCSIIFVHVVTGLIDFRSVPHFSFWILLGVALLLSILIFFFTSMKEAPRFIVIFSVVAFFFSILWMWSAVNILVDILGVLGLLLKFEAPFLGVTMLAWGNSFGEVMANSTFARKGLGKMAFTA
mmetsp:Transcript_24713/g.21947  ORF Transcript_24713/g.21947 Transcript_24713/m.21947 type:complete len:205 (+) Transcript_24713:2-616(+)